MARGFKIWKITLAAPAIRAVLFASVFGLAIDQADATMVGGLPFMTFLLPGLVAVAALERAFESAAFSIVYDKTEGIFGDLCRAAPDVRRDRAGFCRCDGNRQPDGVRCGLGGSAALWRALPVAPIALVFFVAVGSLMIGLFSQISGLWARKWDYINSVQTFIFLPFVFFSGVFFSLDSLPETIQPFACLNPVFYIVDGIRFGLTGQAEVSPMLGTGVCLVVTVFLWLVSYRLFSVGYRMKS